MKKEKSIKGQVTIFVIIGIVLIIIAGIIFFALKLASDDVEIPAMDVDLEVRPAFELVTTCLEEVSSEAIYKIGSNGGRLDTAGLIYSPLSYKSEVVDFVNDKVVYWRHLAPDCEGTECEVISRPELCKLSNRECPINSAGDNSIEESIATYVENNIKTCINNFEGIEMQYDIEELEEPHVKDIVFANGETIITLRYHLRFHSLSNEDNYKEINEYITRLDADVLGIYNFATELLNLEIETNFLEEQTMNLISIYSGVDSPLPPTAEIDFFSFPRAPWVRYEVEEAIQYDLLPFMNLYRFINTQNFQPIITNNLLEEYDQYAQGLYSTFSTKTSDTIYPYEVYTQYAYQPIYVKVGDGRGALIKPNQMMDRSDPVVQMIGLFMTDYRYRYDISYPLVFTIRDPNAFNGNGYDFNIAMEVNVRRNQPGYGNNITIINTPVPFRATLADEELLLPTEYTIYTTDKYTNEPIEDVVISYVCGKEYELGQTKFNRAGDGELKTKFPYCEYGGYVRYQKLGYQGSSVEFNNRLESSANGDVFEFSLWPEKEKTVYVKKRTTQDIETIENAGSNALLYYNTAVTDITPSENVLLNLARHKESPYDTEMPLIGFIKYSVPGDVPLSDLSAQVAQQRRDINYGFEQGFYTVEERDALLSTLVDLESRADIIEEGLVEEYTFKLVPGAYSLDATILYNEEITIPATTMDVTGNPLADIVGMDTDVELPEQSFSTWVSGGANINITFSPAEIYNDRAITFYVLEMTIPRTWADLMEYEDISTYQEDREYYIQPVID